MEQARAQLAPCRFSETDRVSVEQELAETQHAITRQSDAELLVTLEKFENDWGLLDVQQTVDVEALFNRIMKAFHMKPARASPDLHVHAREGDAWLMPEHLDCCKGVVAKLYETMGARHMLEDAKTRRRLLDLLETVHFGIKTVLSVYRVVSIQRKSVGSSEEQNEARTALETQTACARHFMDFSSNESTSTDNKPVQDLIMFLLNELAVKGYRRYFDWCYKPVVTNRGYTTHAWKKVIAIKKFIYQSTDMVTHFDQFKNLTDKPGNFNQALTYLTDCENQKFPDLVKSRTVFSFLNGVYRASIDSFSFFEEEALSSNIVSAKMFNLRMNLEDLETEDWFDIPTPNFTKILDYQRFEEGVQRWMFVMIGRLIYALNDRDRWQVIPFLKGQASSGKSTVIKVAKQLFDPQDVGVLSNNIERGFGLSGLVDKFMFIGPEIKADLKLEQAEFQSIITGEDVSVATKYKSPVTVEWPVPGILAGNEVPSFIDNAGSIVRRVMLWDFTRKVRDGDMNLSIKLEAEMAALLLKCNRAYLWASREYNSRDIWKVVPPYFLKTQHDMEELTNSLHNFLGSDKLVKGEGLYVPYDQFRTACNDHLRDNNMKQTKFNNDVLSGPFADNDLSVSATMESRIYPRGSGTRTKPTRWIEGCDLRENVPVTEALAAAPAGTPPRCRTAFSSP